MDLEEDLWDGVCMQEGCLWKEGDCDLHKPECGTGTEQMGFQPCMEAPEHLLHMTGGKNRQAHWWEQSRHF